MLHLLYFHLFTQCATTIFALVIQLVIDIPDFIGLVIYLICHLIDPIIYRLKIGTFGTKEVKELALRRTAAPHWHQQLPLARYIFKY